METPQWWAWSAISFIAEENADSSHQPEDNTDTIENYCVLKTDGKIHLIVTTCRIVIDKIELTRSSPIWPLFNSMAGNEHCSILMVIVLYYAHDNYYYMYTQKSEAGWQKMFRWSTKLMRRAAPTRKSATLPSISAHFERCVWGSNERVFVSVHGNTR